MLNKVCSELTFQHEKSKTFGLATTVRHRCIFSNFFKWSINIIDVCYSNLHTSIDLYRDFLPMNLIAKHLIDQFLLIFY